MRTLRCFVLAALALPSAVGLATVSPDLPTYLKLRKQYGITQATTPDALMTFVGTRVLEVRGVVRGYISTDGRQLIVLDTSEGRDLFVRAKETPDWLKVSNTTARMLIKATRQNADAMLEADLVAAHADTPLTEMERKAAEKARAAQAQREARTRQSSTQRVAPGNQANPSLSGQIGRGGSASRGSTASRSGSGVTRNPGVQPRTSPQNRTEMSAAILEVLPAYTDFILRTNRRLTRDKAQEIAQTILEWSVHFGVDARLVMALVLAESTFNPNVVSHAGARGLGQLMPGTARGLGVTNSFDIEQNLYGTVKLLSQHLGTYTNRTGDSFEGLVLALAAYNAGPGAVRRHGGVPPYRETQNYVRKVIEIYKRLAGLD